MLRSLSATESPVLEQSSSQEKLGKKNEDDVQPVEEGEKSGEKQPCLDYLVTWGANASPADRLKLIYDLGKVQSELLKVQMN